MSIKAPPVVEIVRYGRVPEDIESAHDSLIAAAHRAHADALEIEARAKRRLADEYDAAQERGEVVGAHDGAKKRVPDENAFAPATASDVGLTRKGMHDAPPLPVSTWCPRDIAAA